MWKKFKYNGRERVAYVPEVGPSFQVLDAGKPVRGFRAFLPGLMKEVEAATNMFNAIPEEIVIDYPELESAKS